MPEMELVMYSRSFGCPYVSVAKRVFEDYALPYRERMIDHEPDARGRVLQWTGFLSVPTLIVAERGSDFPLEAPAPLPAGASPRGIDRGFMITEPGRAQLTAWLVKHQFITADAVAEVG